MPCDRCRLLEREVQRLRAQARRDLEQIEWLESKDRVFRRLIDKLAAENDALTIEAAWLRDREDQP